MGSGGAEITEMNTVQSHIQETTFLKLSYCFRTIALSCTLRPTCFQITMILTLKCLGAQIITVKSSQNIVRPLSAVSSIVSPLLLQPIDIPFFSLGLVCNKTQTIP